MGNHILRFGLLALSIVCVAIMLSACGGGGMVVSYEPYIGISFINYNVDLAAATLDQKAPACVFAYGVADEYFVAWEDMRDGVDSDIYGRFFDALRADPVSSEIVICSASGYQGETRVAYNSFNEEMLVVWEDDSAGDTDIFGQLVDAVTGNLIGGNFAITSVVSVNERGAQVAYNPDQNNYIVIWDENNGTDLDIMAIVVNANGTIPGSAVVLTPTTGDQQSGAIAYDTDSNRYLLVFMDFAISAVESDIYGQFVAHDGGLIGSDFAVNNDSDDQDFPAIAYNSIEDVFLVTWEDNQLGDYDITGQEVMSTGILLGAPFILSPDYSNQENCTVSYNDYWGEYIVAWEDSRLGGSDIYAQALSPTSVFIGYNMLLNDDPVGCLRPAACANEADGEFLVTWAGLFAPDYDIMGQLLDVSY